MIDPEEIRRLIAWQLCETMPPNDEDLRAIYADDVTLDSLGVDSLDRSEISGVIEEEFLTNRPIDLGEAEAWQTVGDIIAFVSKLT